jgi:hypothetical protein
MQAPRLGERVVQDNDLKQLNSQEMVPSANASYLKVAKQMQAPRPGERVVQDNALKPQDRL